MKRQKPHQPTKRAKRLAAILIPLCAILICVGAIFGVLYMREQKELYRNELIRDLTEFRGEYDEQSIVLRDTSRGTATALAEKLGASLRITKDGKFATLTLPEGVTFLDICYDEANFGDLHHMSIDYHAYVSDSDAEEDDGLPLPMRPQYTVNDEGYSSQTYLDYVNLKNTWSTTRGYGLLVAVIDTGIDTDHPEFVGHISEYSYNASEDKIVKDYTAADGSYDWSLIEDEQGHGTSVAGVLASPLENGGIVGVAPDVTLLVIKAECDQNGTFKRTSDLVFGLYYAIERDAKVVNMSFGGKGDELTNPYAAATQLAVDSDIICLAAAGNDSTSETCYPACDPNVIGVGALEKDGWGLASYSNFGENVDIVAPGSTYTTKIGGGYATNQGTSLACPVAAGAVALYVSSNRYSEFADVCDVLYASCYDLGDLGHDWYFGYGALDIAAFVTEERGTVTFNMMTDELENTTQVFIRNHTLQNIPSPERLYAVFDGWYYDPQCTDEYDWYADVFSSDLTLYANWVNEEDGIPYTYVELEDGTIEIRSYTGRRRFITVPATIEGKTVSSIGRSAFAGQSNLRQVTLPNGLRTIGASAFSGCSNLVRMHIPDSVTEIGEGAFTNNVRLSAVTFGGNSALTTIGSFAFQNCARIRDITLPASLREIDGKAFLGASSITSFALQSGNTAFSVLDGVLLSADGKTLVCYPAGRNGTYELPDSVRTVGPAAFAYAKLTQIDLKAVGTIHEKAFFLSRLESLTIPNSVSVIESSAFQSCSALRELTLGTGLRSIPEMAFSYCDRLEAVTIPAAVTSIGKAAFAGCFSLETLEFAADSQLTAIGDQAFSSCSVKILHLPAPLSEIAENAFLACPLTEVHFASDSVLKYIGKEAFAHNTDLTAITLPDGLEKIEESAFIGTGLIRVTLPAALHTLGDGAFADCAALTEILVDAGNSSYTSLDGVLFDASKTTLLAYPAGKTDADYTIPVGTKTVGKHAFQGAQNLRTVAIPDGVETVSEYAFYNCSGVYSYGLPATLNLIERYAFSKNDALYALSIPASVTQIGPFAFAENWDLTQFSFAEDSALRRIGYGAFAYCGVTDIRIPAKVSTIAQGAFEGCTNLQGVTFAQNSELESLSAYLFDGCTKLYSIRFESGSALTSIQAHALEGMRQLTTVDFGDAHLTEIDNFAFRFCESLSSLLIPNGVTSIGRYAFYNCTSLRTLTIPESVEQIGRFAFLGAQDLNVYFAADTLPAYLQADWDHGITGYYLGVTDVQTSGDFIYAALTSGNTALIQYLGTEKSLDLNAVNLGGPIITIGGKAFYYSPIEEVILPDSLITIQSYAFYHSSLKSLTLPKTLTFIGREAFADTPIQTLTIPSDSALTVIEQSAFANTASLSSVSLPGSLTTLGRAAFKSSAITSLSFADGIALTEISEETFAYTKITSLRLPDSVTLIDHNAFRETEALQNVDFGAGADLMLMSNAFYRAGLTSLTIPKNVSFIGEYAFVALPNLQAFAVDAENPYYAAQDGLLCSKDARRLIAVPAGRTGSLTVPDGIEIIGFGAFENTALSEVKFSQTANILSIGYRAFYSARNLTTIRIPASVVAIDYYAFANCVALQSVIFEADSALNGIYEGAFLGCLNLSEIALPDSIIEISDFAFYGCAALDRIPISEGSELLGIYSYAMAYTGLMGDLITPATLIDIGDYAFLGTKITSATIPADHAKELLLGIGVFRDCNSLTSITLPFVGASFEDSRITWFSYIFGAGSYEASEAYLPASLKRVVISEGLTSIGEYAFCDVTTLEEIVLPHSIVTLEPLAFHGSFATYELTNTVTLATNAIDHHTLYFGHGMTGSLRLGEGLERIVVSIEGVTAIHLPASLSYIEPQVFNMNQQLRAVEISPENPHFSSLDGVVYNMAGTEILGVPGGISGHVTLPATLTEIGVDTFRECHNITELTIPEGVTRIANGAFAGDVNLVKITLPATLTAIETEAFSACHSLQVICNNSPLALSIQSEEHGGIALYAKTILNADGSIQFIDNLTNCEYFQIDDFHFISLSGTYELVAYLGDAESVRLPESVRGSSYSISSMRGGTEFLIPGSLGKIPFSAFADNQTLESVIVEEGITEIEDGAFGACHNLRSITLPQSLERLGSNVFYMCARMKEINMPSNLRSIGNGAFDSCGSLRTLTLPEGLESIGTGAFRYCMGLESISIPASLTEIGMSAFESCTSLKSFEIADGNRSFIEQDGIIYNHTATEMIFVLPTVSGHVTLPDTLLSIPDQAFSEMSSITGVTIPDGLTYIGFGAFYNTSITEISLPLSLTALGSDALCTETLTEIHYGGTLRDWIALRRGYTNTQTAVDLYLDGERLINVEIPEGITEIPSDTFTNLTIEHVTFPSTLVSIGERAFQRCSSLFTVHLPASVQQIGDRAFADCQSFRSITVAPASQHFSVYDSILYNKAMTEIVLVPNALAGNVEIPEGVTTIGSYTFEMPLLASIKLPSTLTDIEDYAFSNVQIGCVYNNSPLPLTPDSDAHGRVALYARMVVDQNGTLTRHPLYPNFEMKISDDGFLYFKEWSHEPYKMRAYLGNEETVMLPLTFNGEPYVPFDLSGIKNLIIPNGMTEIAEHAFSHSYSLQSVTIPESVTKIGNNAFYACLNLREINLPATITSLGWGALDGTYYYNNPNNWNSDGLLILDDHLIAVDPDTEYVKIPDSIRSVSGSAFGNCYKMRQVTMRGDLGSYGLLQPLTNLETLVLTDAITGQICELFENHQPLTLKSIVLLGNVRLMLEEPSCLFADLYNLNIYVQGEEKDLKWSENYPNWNNGNTVLYATRWTFAEFLDHNGKLISAMPFSSAQIIRQPWVDSYTDELYRYTFLGFDLDGDGVADMLPATSTVWIHATALYTREFRCVTEGHRWHASQSVNAEQHTLVCACGESATEPHKWSAGSVLTPATHTTEGVRELTCLGCKHKTTEPIPRTSEHIFDQFITNDAYFASGATCLHPAEYYISCLCGEKSDQIFHNGESGDHIIGGEPFDQNATEHFYRCENCGENVASSHEWSDWQEDPTNADAKIRTCTECGYNESSINSMQPNKDPVQGGTPSPGPSDGCSSSIGTHMAWMTVLCLLAALPIFKKKRKAQ